MTERGRIGWHAGLRTSGDTTDQTMRVLAAVNNWTGWQILDAIANGSDEIVAVVLHPGGRRRYGAEILRIAHENGAQVLDGSKLKERETIEAVEALSPDIGVSIFFGYIFKPEFIDLFPDGLVNLHPAYLPYNRGQYPNVWSIVEETPAGVTLHYIDAGLDTGDIIARKEVVVDAWDTGESLYRKLERESVELFQEQWPRLRAGSASRTGQAAEEGTYHRTRDVESINEIDLDRTYSGRELINVLRARTFPPYRGAYFRVGDRKVYLQLRLDPDAAEEDGPRA